MFECRLFEYLFLFSIFFFCDLCFGLVILQNCLVAASAELSFLGVGGEGGVQDGSALTSF